MECKREYPSFDDVFESMKDQDRVNDIRELYSKDLPEDEPVDEEKLESRVKEYFYDDYYDVIESLDTVFRTKRIYRALRIKDIDAFIDDLVKHGKSKKEKSGKVSCIGVYWSWDREYAIVYEDIGSIPGSVDYIIEAMIDPDDIDIEDTINLPFMYGREEEIRMLGNATIFITSIYDKQGNNILASKGIDRIKTCT